MMGQGYRNRGKGKTENSLRKQSWQRVEEGQSENVEGDRKGKERFEWRGKNVAP